MLTRTRVKDEVPENRSIEELLVLVNEIIERYSLRTHTHPYSLQEHTHSPEDHQHPLPPHVHGEYAIIQHKHVGEKHTHKDILEKVLKNSGLLTALKNNKLDKTDPLLVELATYSSHVRKHLIGDDAIPIATERTRGLMSPRHVRAIKALQHKKFNVIAPGGSSSTPGSSSGGKKTLQSLNDVDQTDTPALNDVVMWDGSQFVFVPEGTSFTFSIASFSDGESATQLIGSGVWKAIGAISFTATYVNGPPSSADISSSSWTGTVDITGGSVASAEATNYPGSPNGSVSFLLTTSPADTDTETVTFPNTTLYGVTGTLSENGANEDTTYSKSINGSGTTYEIGIPDRLTDIAQVRVGGVTASFNATRTAVAPTVSAPSSYTNSAGYSENFVYITSTDTFASSNTVESVATSTPLNYLYYGELASATINETQIEALTVSTITNDNTQVWNSVTAGAGEYIWYCFPARLGEPTFKDNDTGLGLDLQTKTTVTVTNVAGFQEDYYCWRTTYVNLGTLTAVTS